jgi:hypothetical protein
MCVKQEQAPFALARITFAFPAQAAIKALSKDVANEICPR